MALSGVFLSTKIQKTPIGVIFLQGSQWQRTGVLLRNNITDIFRKNKGIQYLAIFEFLVLCGINAML